MITVRPATLDDLESMVAVYTAAWRQGFQHMFPAAVFVHDGFTTDRAEECRAVLTGADITSSVVELDGTIVGFSGVRVDGAITELDDIWLHPNAWGTGAATALLSDVEERVRSVGGNRIVAWVPEDSPSGRRFFDKAGWRATGAVEPLGLYTLHPNRLFEYERVLAEVDTTRGLPRPLVTVPPDVR